MQIIQIMFFAGVGVLTLLFLLTMVYLWILSKIKDKIVQGLDELEAQARRIEK